MLDDGVVNLMNEIALKEGLTRARVAQIMNLLKLPADMQVFLLDLDDGKQIRKYPERKLRGYHEIVRLLLIRQYFNTLAAKSLMKKVSTRLHPLVLSFQL